jgi:hypothetical protein
MKHFKHLIILCILLGGCDMSSATKSTQAIIDDAKKHLKTDKVFVDEVQIEILPKNMEVYYVEKEGSYGNIYYHCVVDNGELFTSANEDSFDKLLKKEQYLSNKNLTAEQLVILFRLLKVKMRDTEVVGIQDLQSASKGSPEEPAPPAVTETKNGVEVTFWTKSLRHEPEKWSFTISSDYKVTYKNDRLKPGN